MKGMPPRQRSAPPHRLGQALASAGYSTTRPRQAVIDAIAAASGYLSPLQILEAARRDYPRIGLATVYRTLDLLAGIGVVRKVHLADGCHSYALAEKQHSHHIICTQCCQVIEFDGCDLETILGSVERQTGYTVQQHWLELLGLCSACRATAADPPAAAG